MGDQYATDLLRISVAQICQNHGFSSVSSQSFDIILDLCRRYLEEISGDLRPICDHFGRSEPIFDDFGLVLRNKNLIDREILDYMQQVSSVPFPHKVPIFPVKRPSNKPLYGKVTDIELASRPDHIPHYLPPCHPELAGKSGEKSFDGASPTKSPGPARVWHRRSTAISDGTSRSKLNVKNDEMPDFSDLDAFGLGLVRIVPKHKPKPKPPPSLPAPVPIEIKVKETETKAPPKTFTLILPNPPSAKPPSPKLSVPSVTPIVTIESIVEDEKEPGEITDDFVTTISDTSIDECISNVVQQSRQSSPVVVVEPISGNESPLTLQELPSSSLLEEEERQKQLKKTLKQTKQVFNADLLKKKIQIRKEQQQKQQQKLYDSVVKKGYKPIIKKPQVSQQLPPSLPKPSTANIAPVVKLPELFSQPDVIVRSHPKPVTQSKEHKLKKEKKKQLKIKFALKPSTAHSSHKLKHEEHGEKSKKKKKKDRDKEKDREKKKERKEKKEKKQKDRHSAGESPTVPPPEPVKPEVPPPSNPFKFKIKLPPKPEPEPLEEPIVPVPPEISQETEAIPEPTVTPLKIKFARPFAPVEPPQITKDESPPPRTPSPRSITPDSPRLTALDVEIALTPTTGPEESPRIREISPMAVDVTQAKSDTMETDEDEKVWVCPECGVAYDENADMIACDGCDNWFHWNCVGMLSAPPDNQPWFCKTCGDRRGRMASTFKSKTKRKPGGKRGRKRLN